MGPLGWKRIPFETWWWGLQLPLKSFNDRTWSALPQRSKQVRPFFGADPFLPSDGNGQRCRLVLLRAAARHWEGGHVTALNQWLPVFSTHWEPGEPGMNQVMSWVCLDRFTIAVCRPDVKTPHLQPLHRLWHNTAQHQWEKHPIQSMACRPATAMEARPLPVNIGRYFTSQCWPASGHVSPHSNSCGWRVYGNYISI